MFCITLAEGSLEEVEKVLKEAAVYTDLFELRVDYLKSLDKKALEEFVKTYPEYKFVFTYRSKREGGVKRSSKKERLELSLWALDKGFFLVDFEYQDVKGDEVIEKLRGRRVLLSYHDFKKPISQRLAKEILTFASANDVYWVKLVGMGRCLRDGIRALDFIFEGKEKGLKVISFCMGEKARISRILSLVCGSPYTYVVLKKEGKVAPGQFSITEARELYRALANFKEE